MSVYPNAYGRKNEIPKQNGKFGKEVSLTIPGKETTLEEAIRKYQVDGMRGVRAYYEEEGIELPQFEKMDRIEQLMLLRDVREATINKRKEVEENEKKAEKAKADLLSKKIGESKQKTNEGTNTV